MNYQKKLAQKNPDKLPPHAPEAEQGILGYILMSPVECMSECQEGGVSPDWFYDGRNGVIFHTLEKQAKLGRGMDLISLVQALRDDGWLEKVGGISYVSGLEDVVPSSAHTDEFVRTVREKYQMRKMIAVGTAMAEKAFGGAGTVDELLGEAEKDVLGLRTIGERTSERTIGEILSEEVIPELEDYHQGRAQIKGLTTGIEYFDKLTGGIGGKDDFLWVFAARPGTGKTSLLLDFAEWIALHHVEWSYPEGSKEKAQKIGVPVAIFSMEMTRKALGKRILFQKARADLQRFRTGFKTNEDMAVLTKANADLSRAPIYVDDSARLTIESAKARARRMHRQYGIRLFIWDYLQLMRSSVKRFRPDRVQELAEVTGEIQALVKELKVPNAVLAQMNRDHEKSPRWREPQMSDLKDCGAIEQDADGIVFLYAPRQDEEEREFFEDAMKQFYPAAFPKGGKPDWSKCPRRINLLVEKCRYGPRGICELLFHQASTHFEDWNVWLKSKGLKAPAAGEKKPEPAKKKEKRVESKIDPEDADW